MALINCKECGNQVSSKAEKCPHCGATVTRKTSGCAILFLAFIVLALFGEVMKSSSGIGASGSSAEGSNSSAPPKTAFDFDPEAANDVYQYYQANEVRADNDYKGKWALVTGHVDKIGKDILNHPYVTFASEHSIFSIQCMFSNSTEIQKLADLSPGQEISIAGECEGKLGEVIFRKCQIVSLTQVTSKTHVVLNGD